MFNTCDGLWNKLKRFLVLFDVFVRSCRAGTCISTSFAILFFLCSVFNKQVQLCNFGVILFEGIIPIIVPSLSHIWQDRFSISQQNGHKKPDNFHSKTQISYNMMTSDIATFRTLKNVQNVNCQLKP